MVALHSISRTPKMVPEASTNFFYPIIPPHSVFFELELEGMEGSGKPRNLLLSPVIKSFYIKTRGKKEKKWKGKMFH